MGCIHWTDNKNKQQKNRHVKIKQIQYYYIDTTWGKYITVEYKSKNISVGVMWYAENKSRKKSSIWIEYWEAETSGDTLERYC